MGIAVAAVAAVGEDQPIADMMTAIRGDRRAAGAALGAALSSRHAIRTNPTLAREQCPPSNKKRVEDQEIAKYLLEHKSLYTRALKDGGAAIAQR